MFKKKKEIIYSLFTGLALTGVLFSCADDNFEHITNPSEGTVSSGGKAKFLLAFGLDLGESVTRSRATYDSDEADSAGDTDLVYGDHFENEIGTSGHFLLFFDEDDQLQMIHPLSLDNEIEMDPTQSPGDKIEKRYWTLINDISREELPRKALVVLNGENIYYSMESSFTVRDKESGIEGTPLSDVLGFSWSNSSNPANLGRDPKGLFTMTNATYVQNDSVRVAVPVYEAMYHELTDVNDLTPPRIQLPDNEILIMKVERLVSKFTFKVDGNPKTTPVLGPDGKTVVRYEILPTLKTDMVNPANDKLHVCVGWTREYSYTDNTGNSHSIQTDDWAPIVAKLDWRALVSSWDMNALEPNEYIFKKINIKGYDSFFPGWNHSPYYRTYWAEDPNYEEINYPLQFRQAYNRPITDYSSNYTDASNNLNLLVNYSFEAMNNKSFERTMYLPENTYSYDGFNNEDLDKIFKPGDGLRPGFLDERRDLLAGTHIILPATLQIRDFKTGEWTTKDLYRDPTGIYYTDIRQCIWAIVRQFNYALTSQPRMRFDLFDWDPATGNVGKYERVFGVPSECYKVGPDGQMMRDTEYESNPEHRGEIKYQTVDDFSYRLWYNGTPLEYENIMDEAACSAKGLHYLTDRECQDILVAAMMKDGDGKRFVKSDKLTIQNIRGSVHEHLPIFSEFELGADDTTHKKINNDRNLVGTTGDKKGYNNILSNISDEDEVLSIVLEWGGWVDHYNEGRMYYAAPVTLATWGSAADPEKVWGVVRNAWYRFELGKITEPGHPVDDPKQPIVPNWGGPYDGLSLKVNVLDWHYVDLGGFDLGNIGTN